MQDSDTRSRLDIVAINSINYDDGRVMDLLGEVYLIQYFLDGNSLHNYTQVLQETC